MARKCNFRLKFAEIQFFIIRSGGKRLLVESKFFTVWSNFSRVWAEFSGFLLPMLTNNDSRVINQVLKITFESKFHHTNFFPPSRTDENNDKRKLQLNHPFRAYSLLSSRDFCMQLETRSTRKEWSIDFMESLHLPQLPAGEISARWKRRGGCAHDPSASLSTRLPRGWFVSTFIASSEVRADWHQYSLDTSVEEVERKIKQNW